MSNFTWPKNESRVGRESAGEGKVTVGCCNGLGWEGRIGRGKGTSKATEAGR